MEHNNIYDPFQYAYRRDHNIVQALLYYSLNIIQGFKEGKNTLTCFVDLEGAFDMVWRDGLIFKLHQAGLRGRLLLYVQDYLSGRSIRNRVNSYTSDWISSNTGVPQGSVIAPLLFIFYINDISTTIGPHITYADDLIFWTQYSNTTSAKRVISSHLGDITHWCRKWRQRINTSKTEVLNHTRACHSNVNVVSGNKRIIQVSSKKHLGIILDEGLNFKAHLDHLCSTMLRSLNSLSPVIRGCSIELSLRLYEAQIKPHLERSYPIWCATNGDISKIHRIHRQALVRISGLTSSTPTSTIELLLHQLPLNIRLDEILLMETFRIMRRPSSCPLKSLLGSLWNDQTHLNHKILSPVHFIQMALHRYNIINLQVEPARQDCISRIFYVPPQSLNMELALGSSNTRSLQQTKAAKSIITDQLTSIPAGDPIIFTDGSALGNPGPCGASAIFYIDGLSSLPIKVSESVSPLSTSYHGELTALRLAMEFIASRRDNLAGKTIHIYCDCRAAIMAISSTAIHRTHQDIIDKFLSICTELQELDITTKVYWTPGHVQLKPNELADQEAKHAALSAKQNDTTSPVSFSVIKGRINKRLHPRNAGRNHGMPQIQIPASMNFSLSFPQANSSQYVPGKVK
jgi:ribonuclease HI